MESIIRNIANGQWRDARDAMTEFNINFKELQEAGVSARAIAVLADMEERK